MHQGRVDAVFVGADRIAANGDAANKIGTYSVAVLAQRHGVPFYVVAPTSTIDPKTATGADIPIEERAPEEITEGFGPRTAPADVATYSPAFDVTPAELITAIVTERGIIEAPTTERVRGLLETRL
jgi:methylthioribose-1-phosphate isomerase